MDESVSSRLLENLHRILSKESSDLAAVLELLHENERAELSKRLESTNRALAGHPSSEIRVKAEALWTIANLLQEHPPVKRALENDSTRRNRMLAELYGVMAELYSTWVTDFTLCDPKERLAATVLYAITSMLSDKQVLADAPIKRHIDVYLISCRDAEPSNEALEQYAYVALLMLLTRLENKDQLQNLQQVFDEIAELLSQVQEAQLEGERVTLEDAALLGGIANVIHVSRVVKDYLFTGKVADDNSRDIFPLIDIYCYNAIRLLDSCGHHWLQKVASSLRYALNQLCQNSIWTVAGRSPILRSFVQSALSSEDHLLYTFLPSQRDSILDLLTTKRAVVLNMPTSSGKSLLAELYVLYTLHHFKSEQPTVCYVVPTNALINQVYRRLTGNLMEFSLRIETVLPYYDIDDVEDEWLTQNPVDILISTPEKLDFLVRKGHPAVKCLKLVILDEAHNLADPGRGSKFELLLATIKQTRRDVHFLLMSPFIENSGHIAQWLGDTERDSVSISASWTPTKQFIGCNLLQKGGQVSVVTYYPTDRNNLVRKPVTVKMTTLVDDMKKYLGSAVTDYKVRNLILVESYLRLGSVMVLCRGSGSAEQLAKLSLEYLRGRDLLEDISDDLEVREAMELVRLEMTQDATLIECLRYGIAYHHSKLSSLVKDAIERLLTRKDLLKVVFATTTLAQGLNFPITTVIFDSYWLGSGSQIRKMTSAEFWNIAGRSGRAYLDSEGHVITPFIDTQKRTKNELEGYIKGGLTKVVSSLTSFFQSMGPAVAFDYNLIRDNSAASNFLQYLNHIVNVVYDYKLDNLDLSRIRGILSYSLVYREMALETGYLETQSKTTEFAMKYVYHLQRQSKGQLKRADLAGVSDISYRTITGIVLDYLREVTEEFGEPRDELVKASRIIVDTQDEKRLARVVEMIARIPELKLDLFGYGKFNPESVAKLIIGWVNGKKLSQVAQEICYGGALYDDVLGRCFQYVNGTMRSYVPWGMSIYQGLTADTDGEISGNLSSFIYYGVNDRESVVLSRLGVPRFALGAVKGFLQQHHPSTSLSAASQLPLTNAIRNMPEEYYRAIDGDARILRRLVNKNLTCR